MFKRKRSRRQRKMDELLKTEKEKSKNSKVKSNEEIYTDMLLEMDMEGYELVARLIYKSLTLIYLYEKSDTEKIVIVSNKQVQFRSSITAQSVEALIQINGALSNCIKNGMYIDDVPFEREGVVTVNFGEETLEATSTSILNNVQGSKNSVPFMIIRYHFNLPPDFSLSDHIQTLEFENKLGDTNIDIKVY